MIDEKAAKAAAIEAEKAAEAAEAAAAAALREKVAAETKAAPPPVVVEEDLGDIFGSKDATDDENEDPVKDTIYDDLDRSDGTHEFECSDCGYIIFPAAGREGKFFGDDFCCPNCGADKDRFVDKSL